MSNFFEFWSENEKGMLSVNNYNFKNFLESEHFFKNKPNENSTFNIIKKEGIFLKIKDEWEIKDYVINFILNNSLGQKVFNLITGKASLFKRDYLSMIKTENIEILRDTKDVSYLFYKNGVVEITKDSKALKKYKDYGLNIWEDQVIKRDYSEADHHESEYRRFIWLISGGFDEPINGTSEDKARYQAAVERYNTFQTVIGYLLHSYNSGGDNKAIILNDEAISDDPNGRSGKGVFWNGLGHLKKVQSLNGKSFNFNAQFPYQSVKTDCQVLVWDDVKKNFDFEQLFSVITEGIEITYKGENTIKLPIEESPKILITTNYTIKGKGGSHDARRFEVELSNYFNEKYTPIMEFGHKLFDSWDEKEWARFDCYMIECLKKYLNTGLLPYKAISLPLKKLQVDISKELYDAIHNAPRNEWITFEEFYTNYCSSVKKFTERTKTFVTQSMKNKYCEFFGYTYEERTSNGVKKFKIGQLGFEQPTEMPF
jgi:hypothetical protein